MVLIEKYGPETVNISYYGYVLEIPVDFYYGTIAVDGDGRCNLYDCEPDGLYYQPFEKQWLMHNYETRYQPVCKFDLEGVDPKETVKNIMDIIL